MKQKLLKIIMVLMMITTLTAANFIMLCADVVTYALDIVDGDTSTNNKNIEFSAYLETEDGNKMTETGAYVDSQFKLHMQVAVKQEGYFNGNISLDNVNFKIDTNISNDIVNKIENNVIYLNQINAGESKDIELNVSLLNDDKFDLNLIDMESQISISGIYRDSKQKDISIQATRNIKLAFVLDSNLAKENAILSQEVVTNTILNYEGQEKRVIQIEVKSGIINNLYPIKKSSLNMQAPKISNNYPEVVLVNSNDILATNGKKLSNENWNYDSANGLISIDIKNTIEDNKINWIKDNQDKFIVTYIFDKDVEISNEKLILTSKLEFYDLNSTTIDCQNEIDLINIENDSIITLNSEYEENETYKGNLYFGIEKDVVEKDFIDVNLKSVVDEVNITIENQELYANDMINTITSKYKTTKINVENLKNVLGNNGSLSIIDLDTNNEIANLTGDIVIEDSYYVINYPDDVYKIGFKISNPENMGRIEMESVRAIQEIDRNLVKEAQYLKNNITGVYVSNNQENVISEVETRLNLQETQTSMQLDISKTEFSTMTKNENVEFRITLNSNTEKDELFKNPTIKLELPEKFEKVEINSINLLYEDEMVITNVIQNGNIIEIILNGEQTSYKSNTINGGIIIINANIETSQKIASSTEKVKLVYTNENVINYKDEGIETKDINIVSYAGVVTINQIEDFGLEVVNNEGTKSAKLPIDGEAKDITIESKIINNNDNSISNVMILGVLPTNNATENNNIDTSIIEPITTFGIDESKVSIYYSENSQATVDLENVENAWMENITDPQNVKKYLIAVDKLDTLEEINVSYKVNIPEKLDYNDNLEEDYKVYYNDDTTVISKVVEANTLNLATGQGATIETKVKAFVGGEESSIVKKGEVIKYAVTVTNEGTEDIENVTIKGNVPEGTKYIEVNNLYLEQIEDTSNYNPYQEKNDVKECIINFDNLKQGEERTNYYQVLVEEDTNVNLIKNKVYTSYGDVVKESNEITLQIEDAELRISAFGIDNDNNVQAGFGYEYIINIRNLTNKDISNATVTLNLSDEIQIDEIKYLFNNDYITYEKENKSIQIKEIPANGYIDLELATIIKPFFNEETKILNLAAQVNVNNKIYNTNQLELIAKSVDLTISITSENSGKYVKYGDSINYLVEVTNNGENEITSLEINDKISEYTSFVSIKEAGNEVAYEESNQEIIINDSLQKGETKTYELEVLVDSIPGNDNAIEIANATKISTFDVELYSEVIKHIIEPDKDDLNKNDNQDETLSDNNNNENVDKDSNGIQIISGVAWFDENENGQKDSNEQLLEGINVVLLNVETGKVIKTTKTNNQGFYTLAGIANGKYIVIFEYDTEKYILTDYKKEGISEQNSSKVIKLDIDVDNQTKAVAATETIKVDDNNIANINIGLKNAKTFDFKVNKTISKVIVQNSEGTQTYTYNNETLAKAEIKAKLVNSTTVVVEYKISVINEGEVAGYAKKIVDYLSTDYKFSSELNKNWYQSGSDVYCSSLANELIQPGETKEITLIVTKQMTESNTGLVTNRAEIAEYYNELGLNDIDSLAANKVKGEDDIGTADLILSIKTGEVVTTVLMIISTILLLAVGTFIVTKKVLKRRIF